MDIKDVEHLVEHFTVLTGDTDKGLERIGMFLELLDKRRHLDGLRPGSENKHDFFHNSWVIGYGLEVRALGKGFAT